MSETSLTPERSAWGLPCPGTRGAPRLSRPCPSWAPRGGPTAASCHTLDLCHLPVSTRPPGQGGAEPGLTCPPTQPPDLLRPPCPSRACCTLTPALVGPCTLVTPCPPWGLTPSLPDQGALEVPLPVPTPSPLRIPFWGPHGWGLLGAPSIPPTLHPQWGPSSPSWCHGPNTGDPGPPEPLTRLAPGRGEP